MAAGCGAHAPRHAPRQSVTSVTFGRPPVILRLGAPSSTSPPAGLANVANQPDASLVVVPASGGPSISRTLSPDAYLSQAGTASGPWAISWPTGASSRALSATAFPGPDEMVSSAAPLIPSSFSWDNGGAWLVSVYRVSGTRFVGFFHAEHHYGCPANGRRCPHAVFEGRPAFWSSGGVVYSQDGGKTWGEAHQFLRSASPQPSGPSLGGDDLKTVVWDFQRRAWIAFYGCRQGPGMACAAKSTDPDGAPGTWFKYDHGSFDQPGLGGFATPLPGLQNVAGRLYSVVFDTAIGAWVGLGRLFSQSGIWITESRDLLHWTKPIRIIGGQVAYYPVLVGTTGTHIIGASGRLYYVTGVREREHNLVFRSFTMHLG